MNKPNPKGPQYQVIDGHVVEVKKLVVHKFSLSDVEDPDLYAAEPLLKWQESEQGKWVMEHALESPIWQRQIDHSSYLYQYIITAVLYGKDLTYYYLKWGDSVDSFNRR